MILESTLHHSSDLSRDAWILPQYGSLSFSEIPRFIQNRFHTVPAPSPLDIFLEDTTSSDTVILFLIDGFGWKLFEKLSDKIPLLKRFIKYGRVGTLTSQFPSTTTAHVTTLHSGIPVTDSGILEWNLYEPALGRVIEPVTFHYLRRDQNPHTYDNDIPPERIFPENRLYQTLNSLGVTSHIIIDEKIASSAYSQVMHTGAQTTPYRSLRDGLERTVSLVKEQNGKKYIYFYFDLLDSLAHRNGAYAPKVYGAAHELFKKLDKYFFQDGVIKDKKPLVLLTADHGLTDAHFDRTLYLDRIYPELLTHCRRDPVTGELIAPVGSARDLFLFLKEETKDESILKLKTLLAGKAAVLSTKEAIEKGLWGLNPSSNLLERIGDAVVLPYRGETVWISEEGRWMTKFLGYHGGLSPEEMLIPFISWHQG